LISAQMNTIRNKWIFVHAWSPEQVDTIGNKWIFVHAWFQRGWILSGINEHSCTVDSRADEHYPE
jgi:hypothetical protein